jgi:hypothetical protein
LKIPQHHTGRIWMLMVWWWMVHTYHTIPYLAIPYHTIHTYHTYHTYHTIHTIPYIHTIHTIHTYHTSTIYIYTISTYLPTYLHTDIQIFYWINFQEISWHRQARNAAPGHAALDVPAGHQGRWSLGCERCKVAITNGEFMGYTYLEFNRTILILWTLNNVSQWGYRIWFENLNNKRYWC